MNTNGLSTKAAIFIFSMLISVSAFALDDDDDAQAPATDEGAAESQASLADQATSPVSPLMQLRLQDQYGVSYRNADSYSNAALFQGVFPSALGGGWGSGAQSLIARATIPYVTTPEVNGNRSNGMGDLSVLGFFTTDWLGKGQMFAWGPALSVPTAGDNEATGSGQWEIGPAAVYFNSQTPGMQWGAMVFQEWSFSKTRDNAAKVSILSIQPIFTYHLSNGWYLALPDTPNTYNFETNRWALNLGGVVGRVTKWGKKPIQLFGGVYYNPISYDDVVTSKLTLKINLSFLIPE